MDDEVSGRRQWVDTTPNAVVRLRMRDYALVGLSLVLSLALLAALPLLLGSS